MSTNTTITTAEHILDLLGIATTDLARGPKWLRLLEIIEQVQTSTRARLAHTEDLLAEVIDADHIRVHKNRAGRCGLYAIDGLPIPMLLTCPSCNARHIDEGEFATTKVHHTHACQSCGMVWRPAKVNTVGVQFLPGYKSE